MNTNADLVERIHKLELCVTRMEVELKELIKDLGDKGDSMEVSYIKSWMTAHKSEHQEMEKSAKRKLWAVVLAIIINI